VLLFYFVLKGEFEYGSKFFELDVLVLSFLASLSSHRHKPSGSAQKFDSAAASARTVRLFERPPQCVLLFSGSSPLAPDKS